MDSTFSNVDNVVQLFIDGERVKQVIKVIGEHHANLHQKSKLMQLVPIAFMDSVVAVQTDTEVIVITEDSYSMALPIKIRKHQHDEAVSASRINVVMHHALVTGVEVHLPKPILAEKPIHEVHYQKEETEITNSSVIRSAVELVQGGEITIVDYFTHLITSL